MLGWSESIQPARAARSEFHLGAQVVKSKERPPVAAEEHKARGIQSIVIGFNVLETIADAPGPMALKDLSAATAMAASKLRFYLVSFMQLGLVSQDPASGHYGLGPAAVKLGLSAIEKLDVVRTSRGEMMALADALGYTVFLAVWGSHGPTVVDRVDGRNRTVLEIRVGSVLPLSSSAIGRVYATFMPKAATSPLLQREKKQRSGTGLVQNIEEFDLEKMQREIRVSRLARASGTLLAGFTAIASPILDRAQMPLAVISVIGPIGLMDDLPSGAPARALLEVVTRLSRQIGWSDRSI